MTGVSSKQVLVLGGGIAGATVANRLATAGVEVHLVEQQPLIGGYAAEMGCKATDVCLRCHVCVATDIFKSVIRSSRVHVIPRSRLVEFESDGTGSSGKAVIAREPEFIQRDQCMGCGACVKICPQQCLQVRWPAIYGGVPVMQVDTCLRAQGKACTRCAKACPVDAINLEEQPTRQQIEVEAVVVATGYQPFDPSSEASYGYGVVANVITGLEMERQLAQHQRVTRPSDGQVPRRVAFIQCVGSRSEQVHRRPEDTDYCSAVCCAYALRMARRLQHDVKDVAITVFYMDIQNFGKDFNAFFQRAKAAMTFIRSRPYEVSPRAQGSVGVKYEDQEKGVVALAEFDLVVLSIGIRPAASADTLAALLRIAKDEQGFLGLKGVSGLADSQRSHIFLAGACEAPKDIASSISQAESVCAKILGSESWVNG